MIKQKRTTLKDQILVLCLKFNEQKNKEPAVLLAGAKLYKIQDTGLRMSTLPLGDPLGWAVAGLIYIAEGERFARPFGISRKGGGNLFHDVDDMIFADEHDVKIHSTK